MSAAVSRLPLRPLEIKHLYDFAIRIYRRNMGAMFLAMAVVQLPFSLLTFPVLLELVELGNELGTVSVTGQFPGRDFWFAKLDDGMLALIVMVIAFFYQVLITPLGNLACARLATAAAAGEPCDLRQAFAFARQRYWATQVAIAIFILPLLVVSLVVLLPVLAFQAAGDDVGVMMFALFGIALIEIAMLATALFFPRFFMALNGVIQASEEAEAEGILACGLWYLKRSFSLSQGFYFRLLGLLLLTLIAVYFITSGVSDSTNMLVMLIESGISGSSLEEEIFNPARPQDVRLVGLTLAVTTILTLVIVPLWQSLKTLLYLDLRCRKEAYDLQLLLDDAASPPPARG
jgi:hypothetical protein